MAIRLSGLTSGMDTDAIVKELVSAYSMKTQKYEKASTKLTWKQDAWKNLNTKIYGLYQNVSNMRFSSAYNLRKTSISDATKATVSANSDAVVGTQTLQIKSTAQAAYLTGAQLDKGITADSTLSDLGYTGDDAKILLKSANGEEKEIKVTKDTKISDFITSVKEAGVNASFDANNRRIFINAKKTGEESDFSLIGNDMDSYKALKSLGLDSTLIKVEKDANGKIINKEFTEAASMFKMYYDYSKQLGENQTALDFITAKYDEYKRRNKENADLKIDNKKDQNTLGAYEATKALAERQQSAVKSFVDIQNDLNSVLAEDKQLSALDTKEILDEIGREELYVTDKAGNKTISQTAIDDLKKVYEENHKEDENYVALTDDEAKAIIEKIEANKENIQTMYKNIGSLEEGTDITTMDTEAYLNDVGAKISDYESKMKELEKNIADRDIQIAEHETFLKANSDMADIKTKKADGTEFTEEELKAHVEAQLEKLAKRIEEAAEMMEDKNVEQYANGGSSKVDGSNAEIILNGATYKGESNNFTINGLSINAMAKTEGEVLITTSIDTQGIYDKVKDFLTEYNNVINEMTKLYNAESAGDYEPLTDEEREAMSDEQIEKWEGKIKDSLLRRDTTLNSVMSAMVNAMAQTIDIDGEKFSLSTFGIQTLGFLNAPKNEHYAYHIDGDEEDENSSGKKDKLREAIESNPEQEENFMKKLSENLYKAIVNKMKSTELSSAYKVYNDKEMDKELQNYATAIKKWEDKVADKEDYYFKQFSQMEVALSKLQNQTSSISGLLGM